MDRAARQLRYNRRIFIAPPWPAIFTQDAERKQTLEEAERAFHAVTATYRDYGYELVALPRATVAERIQFIVAHIEGGHIEGGHIEGGRIEAAACKSAPDPYL